MMSDSILEWLWRIVEMGKALLAVNQVRRHILSRSVYLSLSSQAQEVLSPICARPNNTLWKIFRKTRHRDRTTWHPHMSSSLRDLSFPAPPVRAQGPAMIDDILSCFWA